MRYLIGLMGIFGVQNLYSAELTNVSWAVRFDKIKTLVVPSSDPEFKTYLSEAAEIYLNDYAYQSGLMYDRRSNNLEQKQTVLDLIQMMRDVGAVSYEAITICLDQGNKQKKHVLRVRFKGF